MDAGLEEEEEEEWISLKRIVCAFGVGINEEQAWAILHQTATSYVRSWPKIDTGISDDVTSASLCLPELDKLLLNKDGAVLIEHRHAHNKLNGHEDRIRGERDRSSASHPGGTVLDRRLAVTFALKVRSFKIRVLLTRSGHVS